jgi:hypothetical protein
MLFKLWSLILLVSHAAAQIDLDAFPSTVNIGEEYTLKWTAAENYVSRPMSWMAEAACDVCFSLN